LGSDVSERERKEGIMDKLATIKVLIALAVVAVLGVAVSVQAAGARPCDPDCIVVPKVLRSPTTKRLPNEPSAFGPSAPPYAQFIRISGTNRYRVKSLHGGLDD
jgi:hypothetical protein